MNSKSRHASFRYAPAKAHAALSSGQDLVVSYGSFEKICNTTPEEQPL
jgi:hypothetical protein